MGAFRRRVLLQSPQPERVYAEVEDDFHHFGLRLTHDGDRVLAVEGLAHRFPWTTCGGSVDALEPLLGLPLAEHPSATGTFARASENCTHLFDLAGMAVVHAKLGRSDRQYDVEIPDRKDGRTTPRIWRNGDLVLEWRVEEHSIVDPVPFTGRVLFGKEFQRWVEADLDSDTAEAALILRRACMVSGVRQHALADRAADHLPVMAKTCFTFQPQQVAVALRTKGTTVDFTSDTGILLAGLPNTYGR